MHIFLLKLLLWNQAIISHSNNVFCFLVTVLVNPRHLLDIYFGTAGIRNGVAQ